MTNLRYLVFGMGIILGLSSCGSDNDEVAPGTSFTRTYDDPTFSSEYDPLDVLPTTDGGYLMLAATESWKLYLVKTNEDGQVTWHTEVDEAYVNPLAHLLVVNDSIHLVCMNEVTLATTFLRVNLGDQSVKPVATLEAIQYPLSVSQNTDGTLLVLGYNRENKSSTLHKLSNSFTVDWGAEYAVEEDVEEDIIDHLGRTGRQLPFFTGATTDGSTYYFNGFSNYTLSMNFVDPGSGELTGTLNGFRKEGYVSAAHHLTGNQFALARSTFQMSTLLPSTELSYQSIANSGDLVANDFPEIAPDSRLIIKTIQLQGKAVIVYGAHTKTQQLVLYFYDQETGTLLANYRLGITDPYQMGNFTFTEDGGMVVLAETFLIGRFSRLCLFKLSADEVNQIMG